MSYPDTPPNNHVYANGPDERVQLEAKPTRFRPKYRGLTNEELLLHNALKNKATQLETLIETIKPGRYRALALTDLESAIMWAVKELTS